MPELTPPSAGLRVVNRTKSPIHTSVVVPEGDELEVSGYVADQLVSAGLVEVAKAPVKKTGKRG